MALINPGVGASAISGKLGGQVFARNKGGAYVRNQGATINPQTPAQTAVRSAFGTLATRWQGLTDAERLAWKVYADNTPVPGRFQPILLSGLSMYQKCNVGRTLAGFTVVDAAPLIFGLYPLDVNAIGLDPAAAGNPTITFDETDPWADNPASALLVYVSPPVQPTINFYKGKYGFIGAVTGSVLTPPTSPAMVTNPYPVSAGQKLFVRLYLVNSDGRISQTWQGGWVST